MLVLSLEKRPLVSMVADMLHWGQTYIFDIIEYCTQLTQIITALKSCGQKYIMHIPLKINTSTVSD